MAVVRQLERKGGVLQNHPQNVASALIGASKPHQLEENVKASGIELSTQTQQRIADILKIPGHAVKHNVVG
jgi:aryl-alcohol dehydrogenase-like predicted oxidoreductase